MGGKTIASGTPLRLVLNRAFRRFQGELDCYIDRQKVA
jgi:hypothetical protein